ncbi:hypothetical protein KEM56_001418 [Ascosphaera pollenicola]|nr:hypothetical protein KEM56_001418 [Ascosphaera pollenicola]
MAKPFPYTFISCPCSYDSIQHPSSPDNRLSQNISDLSLSPGQRRRRSKIQEDEDEEDGTFDPRAPRSNYSLYPPEHLLYCEDCHQIKCSKCVTEEIVCWYCPSCLFETPSSMVRSEGNRYQRNQPFDNIAVFIITDALSQMWSELLQLPMTALGTGENAAQNGPWVLACSYCMWTTLDIEIKFDKPTNIRGQLSSLLKAKEAKVWAAEAFNAGPDSTSSPSQSKRLSLSSASTNDPANRFSQLKSFYKKQIAETSNNNNNPFAGSDYGGVYSAPGALNRIMSLYSSGLGNLGSMKKSKGRPPVMREALTPSEGLRIAAPKNEEDIIRQMIARECDWDSMVSIEQRQFQNHGTRFVDDLRPLPVFLRTKRAKRCKACKHILVKPEFKPQSTRFRIRLIALSYIPLISIRPLQPGPVLNTGGPAPAPQLVILDALEPHRPVNFLLTMKNHMFDSIKVTLATPSITPGRVRSKVTMLCPAFEVGPNSDVWDEALATTGTDPRSSRSGLDKSAEAGKVWDKGRNWTTVVMEIVPGVLPSEDEMKDDEDVIEVPVFVRLEWEGENNGDEVSLRDTKKEKEGDVVKRELAYWVIIGVGRIRGKRSRHA